MPKRQAIYAHKKIIALYQRRIAIVALFVLILTAVIVIRMFYLQVIEHDKYTTLSENNQMMLLPIPPHRGEIYDRHGVLIAENIPIYNLQVSPDSVKDLPTVVKKLKQYINITDEDLRRFEKLKRQHHRFDKMTLKAKLSEEELASFYVNQYFFPGLSIQTQLLRYYPYGDIMVDVLGYTGRINEHELAVIDSGEYAGTQFIGKIGIEKYFEPLLHGKVGNQQVEVDASGRIIRIMKSQEPQQGSDLYLTIDLKLQQVAKKALKGKKGAVVAIDPNNGEVLVLASQPAYDPNLFVSGISQSDYTALQADPNRPLYNRAIRGQYPPASTIKPFMAMIGLQTGLADFKRRMNDPGYYKFSFSHHIYRDWKKGGHGTVDLARAIIVSCDTFFYDLAVRMGIASMGHLLQGFGFGHVTGIEIREELPGLIPTPAWKKAVHHQIWYPGDTLISGIGQGYMLTTPVQLAHATATLASRGKRIAPHLLLKQESPDQIIKTSQPIELPKFVSHDTYWDYVHQAMQRVVTEGTARHYGNAPYTLAAKTGTAQVANLAKLKALYGNHIPPGLQDNSLFIAFAPVENPKIAVAAIVENSRHALEVVRDVINAYLLEQTSEEA